MDENKINRLVDEFCHYQHGLKTYTNVLKLILIEIYNSGCNISIAVQGIVGPVHYFEKGKCKGIKILFVGQFSHPLEVIWTILHEFGHHRSGPIDKNEDPKVKLDREIEAWHYAEEELKKYPTLIKEIEHFNKSKMGGLQFYFHQLKFKK